MDEAFDLSRFCDVAAALNEGSKQPTVILFMACSDVYLDQGALSEEQTAAGGRSRLGIGDARARCGNAGPEPERDDNCRPPLDRVSVGDVWCRPSRRESEAATPYASAIPSATGEKCEEEQPRSIPAVGTREVQFTRTSPRVLGPGGPV